MAALASLTRVVWHCRVFWLRPQRKQPLMSFISTFLSMVILHRCLYVYTTLASSILDDSSVSEHSHASAMFSGLVQFLLQTLHSGTGNHCGTADGARFLCSHYSSVVFVAWFWRIMRLACNVLGLLIECLTHWEMLMLCVCSLIQECFPSVCFIPHYQRCRRSTIIY